ncbi:MAG: GNAT family N-acetyltransferase [Rikenellaceae bacterium]|nr:GNAT family N-acetyltransferase [Rikenellaceae bacterium]
MEYGKLFRPWTAEDAPRLALLADDPAIARNLRDGFPSPYTLADAEAFIAMSTAQDPVYNYAIVHDGDVVGGIGLVPGQDIHRVSGEIGYWLAPRYWGCGIATRTVEAFGRSVFSTTQIIHIHTGVFSFNRASARVLEKAGFRYLGSMHECAVKDGEIIGLDYYELCKSKTV